MKDKFNYTARNIMVYECPCCHSNWKDEKRPYCPNCEVKLLYSAGEEVYVPCEEDEADFCIKDLDEQLHYNMRRESSIPKLRQYPTLYLKKLTRPTVSEEERTEAEKHEILQGFCEKISKQQDISPEFAAIVQRHFWDLI